MDLLVCNAPVVVGCASLVVLPHTLVYDVIGGGRFAGCAAGTWLRHRPGTGWAKSTLRSALGRCRRVRVPLLEFGAVDDLAGSWVNDQSGAATVDGCALPQFVDRRGQPIDRGDQC